MVTREALEQTMTRLDIAALRAGEAVKENQWNMAAFHLGQVHGLARTAAEQLIEITSASATKC